MPHAGRRELGEPRFDAGASAAPARRSRSPSVPIALRPRTAADDGFLFRLYASTRADELALTGWDEATMQAFLGMQFAAQDRHYREGYAGARCDIVEAAGQPVGRFHVARRSGEIVIVDIALLPGYRGRGIGSRLLRSLQQEARETAKTVVLNVERNNRAGALYRRLGFIAIDDSGVHVAMRWSPDDSADAGVHPSNALMMSGAPGRRATNDAIRISGERT